MQRDLVHLLDILQAAQRIQMFVQGIDRAAFDASLKDQSAVIWQIAVIGEAVRRLSQEYRATHPEIPWQLMAGMRSKLIHDYDRIDLVEVWKVIQNDIPALIAQLEPLVPPDDETEE